MAKTTDCTNPDCARMFGMIEARLMGIDARLKKSEERDAEIHKFIVGNGKPGIFGRLAAQAKDIAWLKRKTKLLAGKPRRIRGRRGWLGVIRAFLKAWLFE